MSLQLVRKSQRNHRLHLEDRYESGVEKMLRCEKIPRGGQKQATDKSEQPGKFQVLPVQFLGRWSKALCGGSPLVLVRKTGSGWSDLEIFIMLNQKRLWLSDVIIILVFMGNVRVRRMEKKRRKVGSGRAGLYVGDEHAMSEHRERGRMGGRARARDATGVRTRKRDTESTKHSRAHQSFVINYRPVLSSPGGSSQQTSRAPSPRALDTCAWPHFSGPESFSRTVSYVAIYEVRMDWLQEGQVTV